MPKVRIDQKNGRVILVREIRIVLYGIGAMGSLIARALLEKEGIEIVGAVDIGKPLGKDLGEAIGLDRRLGIEVMEPERVLSRIKADLAIHATASYLRITYPQLKACVESGLNVVSTCEELAFPYYKYPELSKELNELAKKSCVTILGTGINPGYLMDTLPITMTGLCQEVQSIRVVRMMDSSKRRIPYQAKIGTGLSPEEFRRRIEEKRITGHVGLVESIAMIASALGWHLTDIREFPPEPIIAQKEVPTPYVVVKPGQVAGLKSIAKGYKDDEEAITLEFISYAGAEEEYDGVFIKGVQNVEMKILGGVHGDLGTVGVIVNSIPKVLNAPPGLFTMKDLPIPSATPKDLRLVVREDWAEAKRRA
jgi:4-hydroxy-tetrahydrodipicolinate reductase